MNTIEIFRFNGKHLNRSINLKQRIAKPSRGEYVANTMICCSLFEKELYRDIVVAINVDITLFDLAKIVINSEGIANNTPKSSKSIHSAQSSDLMIQSRETTTLFLLSI